MALTVIPNLTIVSTAESAGNWTEVTGLDPAIFVQGLNSLSWNVSKNATETAIYDYYTDNGSTTLDMSATDTHIYIWLRCSVAALSEPSNTVDVDGPGFQIIIESDTAAGGATSGTNTYFIAGSDTWAGAWKCFVQDLGATPDVTTGTIDKSAINKFHIKVNLSNSGNIRNADNTWIDAIRFGTGLTAYGTPAFDFEDIKDIDETVANRYGIIQEVDGVFYVQGRLTIGDAAGANATTFASQDEIVVFTDRNNVTNYSSKVSSSLYQLNFVGNTSAYENIDFGVKVGSGDTAVGRNGSLILAQNPNVNVLMNCRGSDVNSINLYGSTFRGISGGIYMDSTSTHEFIGNTVDQCGPFYPSNSVVRGCTFSGTTASDSTGSAFIWETGTNIKYCNFIANTHPTGDPHAIYHDATGSYSYINLSFCGNDYDIQNDSTGPVTIQATDSDPSSYENTNGGTTSIQNAVTLIVRGVKSGDEPTNYARVRIEKTDGTEIFNNYATTTDDLNAGFYKIEHSYNYTGAETVIVKSRYKGYYPFVTTASITANGFDVTAVWIADPNFTP